MLANKLKELEQKYRPAFTPSRWVGCQGSKPNLRGFTCGLWTLFHYLTVQAAETKLSEDPLVTLQAIHGYVKYFFGCSDCSKHFQTMAIKDHIWSVPNKDDAVLWLWQAHNNVNLRLKNDAVSMDPEFPKIEYPSEQICLDCRRSGTSSNHSNVNIKNNGSNPVHWNKTEVLMYLKRIYAPQNISHYGIDHHNNHNNINNTMDPLRQTRLFDSVFSDMDMRMGMLLYLFCICMMVLAVKLFVRRGYRKKMYDFTGKV